MQGVPVLETQPKQKLRLQVIPDYDETKYRGDQLSHTEIDDHQLLNE